MITIKNLRSYIIKVMELKMTRQEQIKEMGQIICERSKDGICLIDKTSCDSICGWTIQAEEIYNADYRKVNKDSIILTKEEYIDLSRNYVKEQKAQAVKEVTEKLKTYFEDMLVDEFGHITIDIDEFKRYIDELLKEYEE